MRLMRYRPLGFEPMDWRLGRYLPDDFEHLDKYPLSSAQAQAMEPRPVQIGINWYSLFYHPEQDSKGYWWIPTGRSLGRIEGGHALALKQRRAREYNSWWDYYDQGPSSRCVQFSGSRVMTLMNRKQYEVRANHPMGKWLYYESQKIDEWEGGEYPGAKDVYGGTSVRACMDVMRIGGLVPKNGKEPKFSEGIKENRWITSIDDLLEVLGYQDVGYVDWINSWGRSYPHLVRVPLEIIERVWKEDGEFGVVTDR